MKANHNTELQALKLTALFLNISFSKNESKSQRFNSQYAFNSTTPSLPKPDSSEYRLLRRLRRRPRLRPAQYKRIAGLAEVASTGLSFTLNDFTDWTRRSYPEVLPIRNLR